MVLVFYDEFFDFFFIVVLDGEFISEFSCLCEGDQLLVDCQVFGFFIFDCFVDGCDFWLLVIGIGVVLFVLILQDFEVWECFESIKLVYSVCESKELVYCELIVGFVECEYLVEYVYKLQFILVVICEQVFGCLNGCIIMLIENGDLECVVDLELILEYLWVMFCGNLQMIEDICVVLKVCGMNFSLMWCLGQVVVENYWQVCVCVVVVDNVVVWCVVW